MQSFYTHIVGFFFLRKKTKHIRKKKQYFDWLSLSLSFVFRLFCTQVLFCMIFLSLSSFISASSSLSFERFFFFWWAAFSFLHCCCCTGCCSSRCRHSFNPRFSLSLALVFLIFDYIFSLFIFYPVVIVIILIIQAVKSPPNSSKGMKHR